MYWVQRWGVNEEEREKGAKRVVVVVNWTFGCCGVCLLKRA
jgi:hypothetical protein